MVDDDRELCEELAETLVDEGHTVSMAHDGVAGRKLAAGLDYDILLLDLRLPLASGFEILQSMKTHRDSVGIIVMSGYPVGSNLPGLDSDEDSEDVLHRVAHIVLNKPFDVDELLRAIRALSGRA
jgi:two-component system copper resistance phosphate regulon response regulator CusR